MIIEQHSNAPYSFSNLNVFRVD